MNEWALILTNVFSFDGVSTMIGKNIGVVA